MRENMNKLWQWIQDRKTNTVRRWRSSILMRDGTTSMDNMNNNNNRSRRGGGQKNGHLGHSVSAISLPSPSNRPPKPPEYEDFFEQPLIKKEIEVRRQSFRDVNVADTFPVAPPDLDDSYPANDRSRLSTPYTTPRGTPKAGRSPRQIRFQIPEVRVSFEQDDPTCSILSSTPPSKDQRSIDQRSTIVYQMEERRRSPVPPAEIEWTPLETSQGVERRRATIVTSTMSFDTPPDFSPCSPRRNSASEKARQNLLAQRRQSNVQLVQSITGRRTSTTIIPLTCAQIHLIRALWRQMYTTKGPTVIGSSIFHRLCFKCPIVKEQIRRVPLPPKFQNHDSFVKAHSKAVGELIDQVVENLDHLDTMTDELIRIGRTHARALRGELSGKLWNVVAETFIDCTLEWGDKRCRSETVRKAWALIVAFVIEKIKLGHHEQRKLMLSTRQSLPSIDVSMSFMKI